MNNSTTEAYLCPVCDETFETPYQRGGHFGTNHSTEAKRDSLLEKLQQLADEKGAPPTLSDVDDCRWASPSSFRSVFDSWQAAVESIGCEPRHRQVSETDLIADLHRLRNELSRTPRQRDVAEKGEHSNSAYRNRFGSWNEALQAAGFEPVARQEISQNKLLAELERVATRLSKSPTKAEFDAHGRFCSQTYVNRFGSWNDALEMVDCEPTKTVEVTTEALIRELRRVSNQFEKPLSVSEASDAVEFSVSTYERVFGTWNDALAAAGYGVNQHQTVPDVDLLRNLQNLADELGSSPTVVENRKYGEFSFGAYQNTFGSWNEALEKAGLDTNAEYEIPRGELLAELQRLRNELGHTPTSAEMSVRGRYSLMPYVTEFGSWSDGLREADLIPWATRRLKPHPIYGVGWTRQLRERIRERDGRECASCGMDEETSLSEFNRRLNVHHICRARTSDNPAVFNAPRNLISVCHECHTDVEQYTPGLPPHIDQPGPLPD